MANITGFLPYFYVPAPRGFTESDSFAFTEYLNVSGCSFIHVFLLKCSRMSATVA